MTVTPAALERLQERLSRETRAEVRFDPGYRGLYATDASLYQIEPLGVLIPRTAEDVRRAVQIAAEAGVPVLPRGAATSLTGQTVGSALVIDFTKYLNRIGVVDRGRMVVRVEPGVVLDRLNDHLATLGLMFGPDVSTSDRATIGGMIGNNSAGARSLRFGKTVDHVQAVEVLLDDGTPARFGPLNEEDLEAICRREDRIGQLHRTVRDVVDRHREAIIAAFPKLLRRVSGYNLDEFIPGLAARPEGWPEEPWRFNLARLIVGSEGTLAVVRGAELKVIPKPKAQGLVTLSFATIPDALNHLQAILEAEPAAIELLDRTILDLAAQNTETAQHLDFLDGRPEAVLAAQFFDDSDEEIAERAQNLASRLEGKAGVLGVRPNLTSHARASFWKVRKAGLALLMGMIGDPKPVAFVEDTAVSIDRLPAFYDRFMQVVARHGAEAACYGHADVGCLHIRPVLDMKTERGVEQLRAIAEEISDLVLEFGGAMSGEHGDGLARSRWNRKLFGEEAYAAFQEIKRAFDPDNRLNPGKVVAEPDLAADLRISPDYRTEEPAATGIDFSNQGGFARAVELCSGVGVCRKTATGTMCPSYMVTLEEEHTTRGRANALRLALSGHLPNGFANETLHEALDLCLQCKGCKAECPSNVDLARLKAEALYQKYKSTPPPIGSLLMGQIHRLNSIGSATAPLANATLRNPAFKWLLEKVAGIDRRRTLPTFKANHLRKWFRKHKPGPRAGERGTVLLLDDCFTTYNTPWVGRAAVRVLEAAGYRVELTGLTCCGRPSISKGLLDQARDFARENVQKLAPLARQGIPIVGCEPSCLLSFVDEYRQFRLGPDAEVVAKASHLVDAFIGNPERVPDLPLEPRQERALLHVHCHQKALVGASGTVTALSRIPELDLTVLDASCCGMAGSFGYELGHYDVSVALANHVTLPAARAEPEATLLAPGFSCRSQFHGVGGVEALHPIEFLAEQLA